MSNEDKTWYKGRDVHAWSGTMKQLVVEKYSLLPSATTALRSKFDDTAAEINAKFPHLASVVAKIKLRSACVDNDIGGLYGAGLLVLVWQRVRSINEPETYKHFEDTMMDIGQTCLQGDTHRLFATYIALLE